MPVKVRYNAVNLLFFGQTRLMPGVNRLSDSVYENISHHPKWKSKVKSGVIVILEKILPEVSVTKKVKDPVATEPRKRGRRSIDDLIAEINDTFDYEAMKEWAQHKNSSVRAAAEARLVTIGPSELLGKSQSLELKAEPVEEDEIKSKAKPREKKKAK